MIRLHAMILCQCEINGWHTSTRDIITISPVPRKLPPPPHPPPPQKLVSSPTSDDSFASVTKSGKTK